MILKISPKPGLSELCNFVCGMNGRCSAIPPRKWLRAKINDFFPKMLITCADEQSWYFCFISNNACLWHLAQSSAFSLISLIAATPALNHTCSGRDPAAQKCDQIINKMTSTLRIPFLAVRPRDQQQCWFGVMRPFEWWFNYVPPRRAGSGMDDTSGRWVH